MSLRSFLNEPIYTYIGQYIYISIACVLIISEVVIFFMRYIFLLALAFPLQLSPDNHFYLIL